MATNPKECDKSFYEKEKGKHGKWPAYQIDSKKYKPSYSQGVVGDGPNQAHNGDKCIVAIASRLPVTMRSKGDHFHRNFKNEYKTQTRADGG